MEFDLASLARLDDKLSQAIANDGKILEHLEVIRLNRPHEVSTIEGRAALTVARAAVALSVSKSTVRRLLADGKLKAVVVDRIYLIPVAEIMRFLGIAAPDRAVGGL